MRPPLWSPVVLLDSRHATADMTTLVSSLLRSGLALSALCESVTSAVRTVPLCGLVSVIV